MKPLVVRILFLLVLLGFLVYYLVQFGRYWAVVNPHDLQPKMATYNSKSKYSFQNSMCEEKKFMMDWEEIMFPCRKHFQNNTLARTLATNASLSRIVSKVIRPVGDYSTITIQTYDRSGRIKTVGGDEWRLSLRGPSESEPFVRDLGNGQYEASFLLLEAGRYKVNFRLHDTLCDSFTDPPDEWFSKGGKS